MLLVERFVTEFNEANGSSGWENDSQQPLLPFFPQRLGGE